MNDEQFSRTKDDLIALVASILVPDLEGFLERCSQAEAVGPMLDPTLYRAAAQDFQSMVKSARILRTAQRELQDHVNEMAGRVATRFREDAQ